MDVNGGGCCFAKLQKLVQILLNGIIIIKREGLHKKKTQHVTCGLWLMARNAENILSGLQSVEWKLV